MQHTVIVQAGGVNNGGKEHAIYGILRLWLRSLASGAEDQNSEFPSALWLEAHSSTGLDWEGGGLHLVPLSKGSSVTAPSSDVMSSPFGFLGWPFCHIRAIKHPGRKRWIEAACQTV